METDFVGCDLQEFVNEKFDNVRSLLIDGEPWFVAVDLCRVLEIKNARKAISRLDDNTKMTIAGIYNSSGKRNNSGTMILVNEPGLYDLIFNSRTSRAKEFQRWVCKFLAGMAF